MTDQEAGTARELGQRLARLERILVSVYALVLAALLIAGLSVPFFTSRDTRGDSHVDTPVSVLRVIFKSGTAPSTDSSGDAVLSVLFTIGFIGLLAVVVLLLVLLAVAAAKALTVWGRRAGWILVMLGIIGALVLLTFTLMAAGNHEPDTPGWGAVVLLLGVLGVIPLLTRGAASLVSASR